MNDVNRTMNGMYQTYWNVTALNEGITTSIPEKKIPEVATGLSQRSSHNDRTLDRSNMISLVFSLFSLQLPI
jgi:hypothetical protein